MGRFVLTGSNQFSFLKNLGDSLAGRLGLMSILPLETGEMPVETQTAQIWTGSYPGLVVRNFEGSKDWYSSYLATYLEKDVRMVSDIGKLMDFQILVRLLAARTGQEINTASLAKEVGVSAKTIDSWISVLEAGYLVFRLSPFHANLGKRLIKRPKLYFWDTGLVGALTGIRTEEGWDGGLLKGPLFENLVVSEFFKRNIHRGQGHEFWFYRDNAGREIDLIDQDPETGISTMWEIKSAVTAKAEWAPKEIDLKFGSQAQGVVYRGPTKRNWPRSGVDFVHWKELA